MRANTVVSRHREREITERWTVAFESDDSTTAERTSLRFASLIKEEADKTRWSFATEDNRKLARLVEDVVAVLRDLDSQITTWPRKHGGRPAPPATLREYETLKAYYTQLLKQNEDFPGRIILGGPFIELEAELVKAPRVSDGQLDRPFRSFAGAGGAAGLFIGLFTMPPFFWWRR